MCGVCGVQDAPDVGDEDAGQQRGGDDPGGEALNGPVDLTGPTLDSTERDEVRGGTEATDPVEDDA